MKPYIYLHQVQKEYLIKGQIPVVALRGIDLSVSQGEMIAICGVSGSGKSTLLHIIGCLDKPTTGEYYLDDCNIGELKDAGLSKIRNRKIGFVLQDFGLIPYRTALENVSVPLTFSSRPSSEIKKRSMAALENMGIADLAKRKVSQMSGGQKQRVALARALVNDPDIILADEPTGALDSKTKIEILDLFKSIHDTGKTIIIVTHDSELAAITDRALHMTNGMIV